MALFGGGKSNSLPQILKKIQGRDYKTTTELDVLLVELAEHPDLSARSILFMLSDSTPKVRDFGMARIPRLAGTKLVHLLIDGMRGLDPRTRSEIAKLAAQTPVAQLQDALAPLLHSRQDDERFISLEIIAAHAQWPEFLSFLKSALKDGKPELRLRAARVLRRGCSNPTVRLILIGLLHDEDKALRREAIHALAQSPGPDLVEPFFARLPEEERDSQQSMVDALAKLAHHDDARLEERLLPILASEDPKLREVAVRLLAQIPNRTKVLRAYLVHSRGLATWLRERTHASIMSMAADVLDALIELMQDSDDDVRCAAMVMARSSKDERILPVIKQIYLSDCDWWIRSIAAEVIAQFNTKENCAVLLERIDDSDLRYSIISVLGKMLNTESMDVLLRGLGDEARGIRLASLESLRGAFDVFGSAKIIETTCGVILAIAQHDDEAPVREKAADVLADLGPIGSANVATLRQYNDEQETHRLAAITSELTMANDTLNGRNVHAEKAAQDAETRAATTEALSATPDGATPQAQPRSTAQPRLATSTKKPGGTGASNPWRPKR